MAEYTELILELRKIGRKIIQFGNPIYNEVTAQRMLDAADAIEELSGFVQEAERDRDEYRERLDKTNDLMQKQWIPVTERLPGTGEIVLVYGKRGGIYTAEHNRNARWPGTFWKLNSKSHHCEPTHWMPLPQPPEEDEA